MMKLLSLIFLLLSLNLALAQDLELAAGPDLCVLVYERKDNQVAKSALTFFQSVPNSKIVIEAKPVDFLHCIQEGYQEIVFIAHGFWLKNQSNTEKNSFQLGYFDRVESATDAKIKYAPKLFYNKVFEKAFAVLNDELEMTGKTRLRKFRFAACGIESLKEKHPFLAEIMSLSSIEFNEAPKLSWILKKITSDKNDEKRSISYSWLSESSRCEKAITWRAPRPRIGICHSDKDLFCDREKLKYCMPVRFY